MKSEKASSLFWRLSDVACNMLDAAPQWCRRRLDAAPWQWCRRRALSLRGVKYLALLIASAPLAFLFILLPSLIFATCLRLIGRNLYYKRSDKNSSSGGGSSSSSFSSSSSRFGRKTVLVTGAPHTKGLQVCRFMKAVGHRVILADVAEFRWNAARFSAAVDVWITLPDLVAAAAEATISADYEQGVFDAIVAENVDW